MLFVPEMTWNHSNAPPCFRRRILSLSVMLVIPFAEAWTSMKQPWTPSSVFRQAPCPHKLARLAVTFQDSTVAETCNNEEGDKAKLAQRRYNLRLLLVDHYDSFTFNLVDLLAQMCRHAPRVVAADSARTWEGLLHALDSTDGLEYDGIVLGPGPGSPNDFGLSLDIIRKAKVPILGVCLGHQMIGQVHGANVSLAPQEVHGQVWEVRLNRTSNPLFECLPSYIPVTRYHSLQVEWRDRDTTPLFATATTDDGVVMALQHQTLPHFGVQFHPESIGSQPYGKILLENFCRIVATHRQNAKETQFVPLQQISRSTPINVGTPKGLVNCLSYDPIESRNGFPSIALENSTSGKGWQGPKKPSVKRKVNKYSVLIHKVPFSRATPEQVMQRFLADDPYSFWLDSSNFQRKYSEDHVKSSRSDAINRISILGRTSTRGCRIEYFGEDYPESERGVYIYHNSVNQNASAVERHDVDILTFLSQMYESATMETVFLSSDEVGGDHQSNSSPIDVNAATLPFDFRGGHVGYLGYEARRDTERFLQEAELGKRCRTSGIRGKSVTRNRTNQSKSRIPTASFLWADQNFVYDHVHNVWYLLSVAPGADRELCADATEWMHAMATALQDDVRWTKSVNVPSPRPCNTSPQDSLEFVPNRSRNTYNRNFRSCLKHIRQGDSYELCLTNQIETHIVKGATRSPLELYRVLRRRNPAPFAAFFNWNSHSSDRQDDLNATPTFAIACSSPERFLSVKPKGGSDCTDFEVEAKPIKGTSARILPANGDTRSLEEEREDARMAQALQFSVKNRAENLMIVDLLRNDLSRVCETGSVHVAKLMDIESFATVHQMVSTIRGTLNGCHSTAIDVLKACFPGGSMTGAPKLRTMELLHELEEGVSRGPYSGCLGYFSLNGSMDMNIVIRSAVLSRSLDETKWHVSIGAGGAITALSESDDEYGEMMLKAATVMSAVEEWATEPGDQDLPTSSDEFH